MASVTRFSRNAASAFKLLPWLAGGQTGAQLSQRSGATLWTRPAQVSQAAKWLPAQIAAEDAGWLEQALAARNSYLLPRLPGIDKYLEALDSTIAANLQTKLSGELVLGEVETKWASITESLGTQRQQQAFRRHLGLAD